MNKTSLFQLVIIILLVVILAVIIFAGQETQRESNTINTDTTERVDL